MAKLGEAFHQNWHPDDLRWCQYCGEVRGASAMRWDDQYRYICTVCHRPGVAAVQYGIVSPNEWRDWLGNQVAVFPGDLYGPWTQSPGLREYTGERILPNGDRLRLYREPIDGTGRYRYSEYRNGAFIRSVPFDPTIE